MITAGAALMYWRFLSFDRAMIAQFGDPLRPLEPDCKVIQFCEPLSPTQLQEAGRLAGDRPDVGLYVYGKASRDLDFLKYFEGVRRLHLALYELEEIGGLSHLCNRLESLTFSDPKRRFSL